MPVTCFSPTEIPAFPMRFAAGLPWLAFYCPGCTVIGSVDLRTLDRHQDSAMSALLASCTLRQARGTHGRAPAMVKQCHERGPPMTLGNRREQGVRGLSVACLNHVCRHHTVVNVDDSPHEVEVPSLGSGLKCSKCGGRKLDVRPNWQQQPTQPTNLRYD
jgi:hypothetical protein